MFIRQKFFLHNIIWNTIESLIYHTLLLAYQITLFKVTTYTMYGAIGTIFAGIYFLSLIANIGLDASLAPFFHLWSESKHTFKTFIGYNVLPNYILLSGIFFTLFYAKKIIYPLLRSTECNETTLLYLVIALIVSESIKKTVKNILQITAKVKVTALVEIGTIISYTTIVFCLYTIGYPINGYLIFIPMLLTSTLSLLCLLYALYSWYQTLDTGHATTNNAITNHRIIKSRLYTYFNEIGHAIFSNNFLVPFFAFCFGLPAAGSFKITSTIARSMTVILHKIFGASSNVFLANTKKSTVSIKRRYFTDITHGFYQLLYGIIIFFIINYHILLTQKGFIQGINPIIAFLYFIIIFIENFAIIHEKLLINEEKSHYLCFINVASFICIAGIILITGNTSSFITLFSITLIRIVSLLAISGVTFYWWRIVPIVRMKIPYLVASTLFALFFFFITQFI